MNCTPFIFIRLLSSNGKYDAFGVPIILSFTKETKKKDVLKKVEEWSKYVIKDPTASEKPFKITFVNNTGAFCGKCGSEPNEKGVQCTGCPYTAGM